MWGNIFLGILCLLLAYDIYETGIFIPYYGYGIELGIFKIPFSILLLLTGLYFIVKSKSIKFNRNNGLFDESKYYSICPKCEESFETSSLKDGMCPYCDVKTENLEGFYAKDKKE